MYHEAWEQVVQRYYAYCIIESGQSQLGRSLGQTYLVKNACVHDRGFPIRLSMMTLSISNHSMILSLEVFFKVQV